MPRPSAISTKRGSPGSSAMALTPAVKSGILLHVRPRSRVIFKLPSPPLTEKATAGSVGCQTGRTWVEPVNC